MADLVTVTLPEKNSMSAIECYIKDPAGFFGRNLIYVVNCMRLIRNWFLAGKIQVMRDKITARAERSIEQIPSKTFLFVFS